MQSSRRMALISSMARCITAIFILGNGITVTYQPRGQNNVTYTIVNNLLSGLFGAKPALWMLNMLSEGFVKVDKSSSTSIAEVATNTGPDGVTIDVSLPPKILDKIAYVTEDGTQLFSLVSGSMNAVRVTVNSSGKYSWEARRRLDLNNMKQFKIKHKCGTV